jgi:heme/copper-type cytochrome/quinol oxidase subunit 2
VHIDWSSLVMVVVVAAAATLAVVSLVAFALVGWSARADARAQGPESGAAASAVGPTGGTAVAVLCLAAAASIVGYGLYLIVA